MTGLRLAWLIPVSLAGLLFTTETYGSDCDLRCGDICVAHRPWDGGCIQSIHDGACETRKTIACTADGAAAAARAAAARAAAAAAHADAERLKMQNQAVQSVANAVNELQASTLTGPALEAAINASRNTAINGSMPVPPAIRQQLTGYVSEDSLNRARFKIGDPGFANLAHLLEQGGAASAVTLVDVIVFRGPTEADDPSTWAHELKHFDQYAQWGVHNFAVSYVHNWHSVEEPAYRKGDGFAAWRQQQDAALPSGSTEAEPVNIDAYCQSTGGGQSHAIMLSRGDAYSWRCSHPSGPSGVSVDDACRMQYGPQYRSIMANRNDAYSWSCIR
jgi:hypothetical protein